MTRQAAWDLANRLPGLLGVDAPYTLFGVHRWQFEANPHPGTPPIDLSLESEGLFFSFLPATERKRRHARLPQSPPWTPQLLESSLPSPAFTRRGLLEEAFRRRLRDSRDLVPLLPVFADPARVLLCRSAQDLASYLDSCWHESVLWGLAQLPPLPQERPPGTWASRRAYLEEVRDCSLFPITHA